MGVSLSSGQAAGTWAGAQGGPRGWGKDFTHPEGSPI